MMPPINGRHLSLATPLFLACLAVAPAYAGSQGLKQIMRQLEADYARLSHAILLEDFDGIEAAAGSIAAHPRPALGERLAILATVGSDSGRFKQFDDEMTEAASGIVRAAAGRNMDQILEAQAGLLQACMQCHVPFRKKIVAVN